MPSPDRRWCCPAWHSSCVHCIHPHHTRSRRLPSTHRDRTWVPQPLSFLAQNRLAPHHPDLCGSCWEVCFGKRNVGHWRKVNGKKVNWEPRNSGQGDLFELSYSGLLTEIFCQNENTEFLSAVVSFISSFTVIHNSSVHSCLYNCWSSPVANIF